MKEFFNFSDIEMFSREETLLFGLIFCFIIVLILMIYFIINFIQSLVTDRIYYHYKHKAIKELKKCLRQIRIEHEQNYVQNFEMLYSAIKKGENANEKNIQ